MTLIAAFRCDTGVVICADTQETVGAYRAAVDKIGPTQSGNYDLVIGGAGQPGGLIDSFTEDFTRAVGGWPAHLDEQAIRVKIRRLLLDFYREEVSLDPSPPNEKRLEFIICVKKQKLFQYLFVARRWYRSKIGDRLRSDGLG